MERLGASLDGSPVSQRDAAGPKDCTPAPATPPLVPNATFTLPFPEEVGVMDRRVRKVVEIIDGRWRLPLRVEELARHVGLGASRLEHLFKEEARTSIRDFIHERRLREAARMLVSSEERVSVISFHVGFQHVANFNHAFKKRFGVCPRQYRENGNGGAAESTK